MEGHQSFEEDDVGRVDVSGLWQALVLHEGILGDSDWLIGILEGLEDFVGEVEIEGQGVVEIIVGDIDFIFIDA